VLENRFLRTFCAVGASAILVFGSLILLTSTAPWSPRPEVASESSTPDSPRVVVQEKASIDAPAQDEPVASDQADISPAPQPDEADRTFTASTGKEPDEKRSDIADPETSSPDGDAELAATGMPLDQDDVSSAPDGSTETVAADDTASQETTADTDTNSPPADATGNVTAPVLALKAPREPEAPVAEDKAEAATAETAEMLATLPPRAIASDRSEAATDQIAEVLAALPPAPPAPPAPVAHEKTDAATVEVASALAATKPAPAEVAVLSPPPPLPKRKPAEEPPAPKEAVLPAPRQDKQSEPEEPKPDVAQKDEAQPHGSKSPWQAMALAPADKPVLKAPTARPSGTAYAAKVWSALARHKPRAGQRGSTSVSFAIGENGALRAVRVARSSGNARLDQLAP